jgi:hypothetical protein
MGATPRVLASEQQRLKMGPNAFSAQRLQTTCLQQRKTPPISIGGVWITVEGQRKKTLLAQFAANQADR